MRFMQFKANDSYSYTLAKLEKKERGRGSHLSYMFRLPFAAGNVFSASMLDTLLYQAFVKDYLIMFVRLLIGIDQAVGSGHLSCMTVAKDDLWIRTYGRLYQKLCSTTCEIPIGIFRKQQQRGATGETTSPSNSSAVVRDQSALNLAFRNSVIRRKPRSTSTSSSKPTVNDKAKNVSLSMMGIDLDERFSESQMTPERHEISQMVKSRMHTLSQPSTDNDAVGASKKDSIQYVIINPSYDLRLELDDIIYLIRPSSLSPLPSPLVDERKFPGVHRMEKREEPPGADNSDMETTPKPKGFARRRPFAKKEPKKKETIVNDGNSRIPIIYMADSDEDGAEADEEEEEDVTAESLPDVMTHTEDSQPRFGLHPEEGDDVIEEDPESSTPTEGLKGTVV